MVIKKRGNNSWNKKYMNKKPSQIKAIIFDYNGVFTLHTKFKKLKNSSQNREDKTSLGFHYYVSKELDIPLEKWFDAIDTPYTNPITSGKFNEKEVVKSFSERLNVSEKKLYSVFEKVYKKNYKQNKWLFKQAFKLKEQGYKIAILSDQWPISKKYLIDNSKIKHFNESIISCDVRIRKPNKEIYKLILNKLNLKGNQCIFIDDRSWNLKPAEKLGMKTILFENNKKTKRKIDQILKQNN